MSGITTHVLDTARGRPAAGIDVVLEKVEAGGGAHVIGEGRTDGDGRVRSLLNGSAAPGAYRLTFTTRPYFDAQGITTFYPYVAIVFEVAPGQSHYHVPLLISPFGYTTYRGS
jgi:5-hydroxyisourate hydrolase